MDSSSSPLNYLGNDDNQTEPESKDARDPQIQLYQGRAWANFAAYNWKNFYTTNFFYFVYSNFVNTNCVCILVQQEFHNVSAVNFAIKLFRKIHIPMKNISF